MASLLRRQAVEIEVIVHGGLEQKAAFLRSSGKGDASFGNGKSGRHMQILKEIQYALRVVAYGTGTHLKTCRQLFIMKILSG